MKVYLASKSPRRQALLHQIGVQFQCIYEEIDESVLSDETPYEYIERVTRLKAIAGWSSQERLSDMPLLAADTSVIQDNNILGKPSDKVEALKMLSRLSGNTHQVLTGVVVTNGLKTLYKISETEVRFAKLTEQQLVKYIDTNDCEDKAGAYGIQGYAARFIESISGSYSGVVGLPLFETAQLLEQFESF